MSNRDSDDDNDIRPEYDFSQGVRGKHAARFSVSREEPPPAWLRDAIRYDRQAWISEALRRSQEIERLLIVYLALAFHLDPAAAGKDVSHLLEDTEGEALGRISADLEAGKDLWQSLDRLFDERSWLVHRSFSQQAEEKDPQRAGQSTARLQRFCSDAAALTEQLRQMILARFLREGMTETEFQRKAEAVIHEWLAA